MKYVPDSETAMIRTEAALNRSVFRACSLMAGFSLAEPQLALAELAERTGLAKPTAHRLASTLVQAGFMSQAADGRYGLGFKLLELGAVVRENLDLVVACSEVMRAIADETGESVLLARAEWDSGEVVIVERIDSAHALAVLSPIGRRSKIAPGCLGRALLLGLGAAALKKTIAAIDLVSLTRITQTDKGLLLAELDQARGRGYAYDRGEYLDDVSGVAVPVLVEDGRPLGAIGVVGPTTRIGDQLDRLGLSLFEATRSLRAPAPAGASAVAGGVR